MTMPKLWLPPKVWFHGSQSTSTRSSSASTGMDWFICCRLAAHMPCVMITALGALVEPEVNMNLAMLSPVMAAWGGGPRGGGGGGRAAGGGGGAAAGRGGGGAGGRGGRGGGGPPGGRVPLPPPPPRRGPPRGPRPR